MNLTTLNQCTKCGTITPPRRSLVMAGEVHYHFRTCAGCGTYVSGLCLEDVNRRWNTDHPAPASQLKQKRA